MPFFILTIEYMPEGDSIHRLARIFAHVGKDRPVFASSPQGRFADGAAIINGTYLASSQAFGKHLFMGFSPSEKLLPVSQKEALERSELLWLHIHLGLYGFWRFYGNSRFNIPDFVGAPNHWHQPARVNVSKDEDDAWQPPEPKGTVRLRMRFENGIADVSGPNTCELLTPEETHAVIDRLGPDPLRIDIDGKDVLEAVFIDRVKSSSRPIAQLVMDQSVAAGPGNIYRSECLFRVGINPHRRGKNVSAQRLRLLWDDLCQQMERGLRTGRITTIDEDDIPVPLPEDDLEAERFYVYHRTSRHCLHCGAIVREETMAGRRMFWCPNCQAR